MNLTTEEVKEITDILQIYEYSDSAISSVKVKASLGIEDDRMFTVFDVREHPSGIVHYDVNLKYNDMIEQWEVATVDTNFFEYKQLHPDVIAGIDINKLELQMKSWDWSIPVDLSNERYITALDDTFDQKFTSIYQNLLTLKDSGAKGQDIAEYLICRYMVSTKEDYYMQYLPLWNKNCIKYTFDSHYESMNASKIFHALSSGATILKDILPLPANQQRIEMQREFMSNVMKGAGRIDIQHREFLGEDRIDLNVVIRLKENGKYAIHDIEASKQTVNFSPFQPQQKIEGVFIRTLDERMKLINWNDFHQIYENLENKIQFPWIKSILEDLYKISEPWASINYATMLASKHLPENFLPELRPYHEIRINPELIDRVELLNPPLFGITYQNIKNLLQGRSALVTKPYGIASSWYSTNECIPLHHGYFPVTNIRARLELLPINDKEKIDQYVKDIVAGELVEIRLKHHIEIKVKGDPINGQLIALDGGNREIKIPFWDRYKPRTDASLRITKHRVPNGRRKYK